jgi:hypothetical protein
MMVFMYCCRIELKWEKHIFRIERIQEIRRVIFTAIIHLLIIITTGAITIYINNDEY